jgi:hypothetical protein
MLHLTHTPSCAPRREKAPDEIPGWVADCVLEGKWPQHKELKTAFVLQPVEGSGLPSLLQSRLNAPRVLEVSSGGLAQGCCCLLLPWGCGAMIGRIGTVPLHLPSLPCSPPARHAAIVVAHLCSC